MKATTQDKLNFVRFLIQDIKHLNIELMMYRLGSMVLFLCFALDGLWIIVKQRFSLIDFGVIIVQLMIVIMFSRNIDHLKVLKQKEEDWYKGLLGGINLETYKKN